MQSAVFGLEILQPSAPKSSKTAGIVSLAELKKQESVI